MLTVWKEHKDAGITFPEGFVASAVRCGLKTTGKDLALLVSDSAATAAGVFTTNRVQAPCVKYSSRVVRGGTARAILVNAGNANACNGEQGEADNRNLAEWVSRHLHIAPDNVLIASTGIIGHFLPMDKMQAGIQNAVDQLERDSEVDIELAKAVMTTDTYPKMLAVEADSDHWVGPIRFGGMCKGSGMIAPNMATMLSFITTDARLPAALLQEAVTRAANASFNRVTVDGDTSTNDMYLMLASGMGHAEITRQGAAFEDFVQALTEISVSLAKEIARDGEGATKLVEIRVQNAATEQAAHQIAKSVAESPLVKTALFGNDPNWGRLLMAAGKSGAPLDPTKISVTIGDQMVCENGGSVAFDRDSAHDYLTQKEIVITFDLNMGEESATFWTCDYSYDYIKINAEYHT